MPHQIKPESDEKIIMAISTHWIKYVLPTIIFIIIFSASTTFFIISGIAAKDSPVMAIVILFTGMILMYLVVHWFFHRLLSEAMEDIIVTTKRVIWIKESLFQIDDVRQIPLTNIQGVESQKRGLLQTVLRYGSLWFDTGGTITTDQNAIMTEVPHPNDVAREINTIIRQNL
ncbi:hypothetical protein COU75_04690 [Candidatus Peregrinibacteria bacterium CG10_big_fil_rev_8_21_14_0_10_42_8]|nr:MAG: hypothetical protein COU75_04690 [Candidatus Peregrinibacteria bacterium CG10_big_fil_rev_8_21_14_0_10_42_8]